jgi:rhodanese-related sulfurtransferase
MTYAGDVTPSDTFERLSNDADAVLVDCRTHAEWSYVGAPDLATIGKAVVPIEWSRFPDGAVNADFITQLEDAGVDRSTPVFFLCRSGVRSKAAASAATAAGWAAAYNITDGFEGPPDEAGHRGTSSGWKVDGLPWKQP